MSWLCTQVENIVSLAVHENFLYATSQRNAVLIRMHRLDLPTKPREFLMSNLTNPDYLRVIHSVQQPTGESTYYLFIWLTYILLYTFITMWHIVFYATSKVQNVFPLYDWAMQLLLLWLS